MRTCAAVAAMFGSAYRPAKRKGTAFAVPFLLVERKTSNSNDLFLEDFPITM
jgi:hypothetical protein